MIDDSLSWKHHISFVCSRISRNTGVISKLEYYLSIKQLRQIYYNLIYPYISCGVLTWGSVNTFKKNSSETSHIVRLICFAKLFGGDTEKAKPLLHLLGLLTVNNIYRLQVLKFFDLWHKGFLPEVSNNMFQYASNIHGFNTRYAAKHNVGKQLISFMATDIWKDLPTPLKKKSYKVCLLFRNKLYVIYSQNNK